MSKTKKVNRSADTGEFVSAAEAAANPKETYADTVPIKDADLANFCDGLLAFTEAWHDEDVDLTDYHTVVDIGELTMPCITGVRLDKENKRIVWVTNLSVPQESDRTRYVPDEADDTFTKEEQHPEGTEAFDG